LGCFRKICRFKVHKGPSWAQALTNMIDWVLSKLEWLSKYGFIDIIFGIGIFTFIAKILKKKVRSDIESVDFLPHLDLTRKEFRLGIKNQSNQPLYLYKAYIKPGYFTERIDKTTVSNFFRTLFFKTWKTDKFPKITSRRKTTKGLYVLQVYEKTNDLSPTLFIEPFHYKEYVLDFDDFDLKDLENADDIFDNRQFGELKLYFVHGTNSGQLELQL
jgi:hypothetical protein